MKIYNKYLGPYPMGPHDAMVLRIFAAIKQGGKAPPEIAISSLAECMARAAKLLYGNESAPEQISKAINTYLLHA